MNKKTQYEIERYCPDWPIWEPGQIFTNKEKAIKELKSLRNKYRTRVYRLVHVERAILDN